MRALIFFFAVLIASCGMNRSDRDIESELDPSIRAAAPGVVMTVKNGVVTLSGTCPDESCRHTTEMNAKKTKGVKEVVNNIIISTPPAPGSAALKQ
jgi:hyperosmotically inducible periplasmic protein